jgi:hypothetical protein
MIIDNSSISIHTHSDIQATQISGHHAWIDGHGAIHGSLGMGSTWIVFDGSASARTAAAELLRLAKLMDEKIAQENPALVES